jgi:hypothetical protein
MLHLKLLEKQKQAKYKLSRREIIIRINKIETKKIQIYKHLTILTKRREKTQINKIRNEKGEITTNTQKIKGIVRDYFENLYDYPKLNQRDIKYLDTSITHNEIEAEIVSQKRKVQVLTDTQSNFNR